MYGLGLQGVLHYLNSKPTSTFFSVLKLISYGSDRNCPVSIKIASDDKSPNLNGGQGREWKHNKQISAMETQHHPRSPDEMMRDKKAKVDLKIVQRCIKTVVEQMLSVRKAKRGK